MHATAVVRCDAPAVVRGDAPVVVVRCDAPAVVVRGGASRYLPGDKMTLELATVRGGAPAVVVRGDAPAGACCWSKISTCKLEVMLLQLLLEVVLLQLYVLLKYLHIAVKGKGIFLFLPTAYRCSRGDAGASPLTTTAGAPPLMQEEGLRCVQQLQEHHL